MPEIAYRDEFVLGAQLTEPACFGLGRKLYGCSWHHYVTLRTDRPTSLRQLQIELGWFLNRLDRASNGRVWYAYSIEWRRTGVYVVRVLLFGTDNLRLDVIQQAWRLGPCDARVYDASRHGAFAVAWNLRDNSYEMSRTLPPPKWPRGRLSIGTWRQRLAQRESAA